MTPIVTPDGLSAPDPKHVDPKAMQLAWQWSREAVEAALAVAGRPPTLNIQAMMSAAFAVDGPNLTAQVFEVVVGERVRALDDEPYILDTQGVAGVALSGQFLLALLSGDWSIIRGTRTPLPSDGDSDQLTLDEAPDGE